jgi:hypothetical protein
MMLITGALTIILFIAAWLQVKCGRVQDCSYMAVLYIIIHVGATILVYEDLLPEALIGPKEVFEYQILINFIIINL